MGTGAVKIKVCGLTRPEDASAAAGAGVDAIGLNFVAGPRKITVAQAKTILAATPAELEVWALFDVSGAPLPAELMELAATERVTRVQMYGDVDRTTIGRLQALGLSAVAVRHIVGQESFADTDAWLAECGSHRPDLLLLDSAGGALSGGTGKALNWRLIAERREAGALVDWPDIVLAGGLKPDNVEEAVAMVRPAWVDVSSGVESAPGIKDAAKMAELVAAVGEQRQ